MVIFRPEEKTFLREVARFQADFHKGRDASLNFVKLSPRGVVLAAGGDEGVLRLYAVTKQG